MVMTKEEITMKITKHPKFKSLGFVQQDRVPVVASWIHFVLSGLISGIDPTKVLLVVQKHRVNDEFKGIPLAIVTNWLQQNKSQLTLL